MATQSVATIWERLIRVGDDDLTTETARYILSLGFDQAAIDRVNLLSEKVQEGTLTSDERLELDEYLRAGDVLALWQSKARRTLKKNGS